MLIDSLCGVWFYHSDYYSCADLCYVAHLAFRTDGRANYWNASRCLLNSGQFQSNKSQVGRIRVGCFGRRRAEIGLTRPVRANCAEHVDQHRPVWPGIDRISARFRPRSDQIWPELHQIRPTVARARPKMLPTRPNLAKIGSTLARRLPNLARNRRNWTKIGPESTQHWPQFGHLGPMSAKLGQISTNSGKATTRFGPKTAHSAPTSAKFRPPIETEP